MPVQLDIAGNFAAGQKATLDRRRAKQFERMNDYELAAEDDSLVGRRSAINRERTRGGLDPYEFGDIETNGDPMFMKLINWWKERRANRVEPSNTMPEQMQPVGGEMNQLGMEGDRFQELRDGGRARQAIPRYQDGGGVSEAEMARRRAARQAEFRRQGINTRASQVSRGGAIPREGIVRRATNALRGRAASAAGRARAVAGGAAAAGAALLPQFNEDYDRRIEQRFGFAEPGPEEGDASIGGYAKHLGRRALGYASDVGGLIPGVSDMFRDNQQRGAIPEPAPRRPAIPPEAQAEQPEEEEVPRTPDEAVAQEAIAEGTAMAEEAQQRSAPPGQIDFSQVDFEAGDIPNMPVSDWIEYRAGMVSDLMMQGADAPSAHAKVTQMQQQGFVDYAQQALMHLQGGNSGAAATALRAAYQYFPNGTDIRLGAQQGKDGQPVIVGQGFDENSNEPKGQPMILNSERLATMIENFSNPAAFTAWTKDWRDEQFARQQHKEIDKPEAESNATYRDRAGRAALMNADANMADARRQGAGAQGRSQSDLDRANAAFLDAVEMLGYTEQGSADRLASAMSQIYSRSNWQYPQVIEFIRQAEGEGRLEEVMQALGLGE
jgi:hypothetical protein